LQCGPGEVARDRRDGRIKCRRIGLPQDSVIGYYFFRFWPTLHRDTREHPGQVEPGCPYLGVGPVHDVDLFRSQQDVIGA